MVLGRNMAKAILLKDNSKKAKEKMESSKTISFSIMVLSKITFLREKV